MERSFLDGVADFGEDPAGCWSGSRWLKKKSIFGVGADIVGCWGTSNWVLGQIPFGLRKSALGLTLL